MRDLLSHHRQLEGCRLCPKMCGRPVHGPALEHAKIMLIGQAPGPHEEGLGKPFAYTAGKTLFKWLHQASGYEEEQIRQLIYFAAVARCYPGKNPNGGGDREPDRHEIQNCSRYLQMELEIIKPQVILAVGKLAIREVLVELVKKNFTLSDVVGKSYQLDYLGVGVTVIPLPHPSGISRWHKVSPGKEYLQQAIELCGQWIGQVTEQRV